MIEILLVLGEDNARYSELLHGVPGIHQRILSERLRELEAFGLVNRLVSRERSRYGSAGPGRVQVTYSLTEAGTGLRPALEALRGWVQSRPSDPERD